jgi:DNA-binding SARP family transcriptional activator/Tfp pilus assembly protein PilF
MAAEAEFGLLGPLLIRRGGVVTAVSSGKQRALLAALLLRANRAVSVDELTEALWGSGPPASARVTLQNYVKRLRKALGSTGDTRITTVPHGYLIRVDADELDVSRFEAAQGRARIAARQDCFELAGAELRRALSLWRGEPLADVPSELLTLREVPRLTELRLHAVEELIRADLQLGHHAEVIAELRRLTSDHPLRERLHALLMLALYRDGQQAEALSAYQHARRALIEELGAEPGPELRRLEHQVLTADPALAGPAGAGQRGVAGGPAGAFGRRAAAVVPRQLPAPVGHFTGRARELGALTALLDQPGQTAQATVVISAIGGMAGVGKTALALHWAHRVAGEFPDGQLYVNLRGYDPGQPVPPGDALAGFLSALGVPGQDIPPEPDERAAKYRSLLAGQKVLVLLDNAGSVEQVRPLLPGTPGCAVLVTSRDTLAGLVARDGASRLDLDLLPLADAVSLLRALIGVRVDAEPRAAAALATHCCLLPLALRLAAELAAARPHTPLADLAAELADQHQRLDLLDAGGDPRTAVRAVFSWSYQHLEPDTARTFRLTALHPGPDLDSHAVAALTATTAHRADRLLDQLTRASLIHHTSTGRYTMHDLLRAYATELPNPESDRHEALTRLLDHFLHTASSAARTLFPADVPAHADAPGDIPGAVAGDEHAARAWLNAERANLAAVAVHASEHGRPGYAIGLSTALFRYLPAGGFLADALMIHGAACQAAVRAGDRAAEAGAVNSIGTVYMMQGRHRQAEEHFQRALRMSLEAGDHLSELRALLNLGEVSLRIDAYADATASCQQALELSRTTGDRIREARALMYLGLIAIRQGHYQHAAAGLFQAAEASRAVGDLSFLTVSLTHLGYVEARQGRFDRARRHLQEAKTTARHIGHAILEASATESHGFADLREGRHQEAAQHLQQALRAFHDAGVLDSEADVLCHLGELDLQLGRPAEAVDHYQQALTLNRQTADPSGEAEARNGLGEAALAQGALEDTRAHHEAALAIARKIPSPEQQARAHEGLGNLSEAAGDAAGARRHWRHALARYTDMNVSDADRIRAKLAATKTRPPQADSRAG